MSNYDRAMISFLIFALLILAIINHVSINETSKHLDLLAHKVMALEYQVSILTEVNLK